MPIMLYDIKPTIQTYIVNFIMSCCLIHIYYKKFINRKIIVFSVLFFLLAIIPTFIQKDYAFFTHRLMIGIFGIVLLLSLIFEKVVLKFPKNIKYFSIVYIFIFVLFSFCSYIQIDKYKNSFVFWSNAYKDAPNYHLVCDGLAKQYLIDGNYDKSIELFYEAKKLKNLYDYDLNICTALIAKGDLEKAKYRLLRMTKLKDDFTTFRYLSEIYRVQGDIENSNLWSEKIKKIFKQ